jgi:hypothetical protein
MFESNRADQSKISTMDGPPAANIGLHRYYLLCWHGICNVIPTVVVMTCKFDIALRDSVEASSDDRFAALSSIGGEYIGEDKLRLLLKKKIAPVCYVWFEPCDMMDIEQVYQPFFFCCTVAFLFVVTGT